MIGGLCQQCQAFMTCWCSDGHWSSTVCSLFDRLGDLDLSIEIRKRSKLLPSTNNFKFFQQFMNNEIHELKVLTRSSRSEQSDRGTLLQHISPHLQTLSSNLRCSRRTTILKIKTRTKIFNIGVQTAVRLAFEFSR